MNSPVGEMRDEAGHEDAKLYGGDFQSRAQTEQRKTMVTNPGTATTEVVRMQQTGKISVNEAVVLLGDIVDDVVQETFEQEEEMKK